MKLLPIGRNIVLVLMSLFVVACAKSKMSESTQTQDITFKKGKLIEVAYLSVKKKKGKSLKEAPYFDRLVKVSSEVLLFMLFTSLTNRFLTAWGILQRWCQMSYTIPSE